MQLHKVYVVHFHLRKDQLTCSTKSPSTHLAPHNYSEWSGQRPQSVEYYVRYIV